MKATKLTSRNLNAKNIQAAVNNPFGIKMENTPEVRNAVANKMDEILKKLHAEAKANKTGFYA